MISAYHGLICMKWPMGLSLSLRRYSLRVTTACRYTVAWLCCTRSRFAHDRSSICYALRFHSYRFQRPLFLWQASQIETLTKGVKSAGSSNGRKGREIADEAILSFVFIIIPFPSSFLCFCLLSRSCASSSPMVSSWLKSYRKISPRSRRFTGISSLCHLKKQEFLEYASCTR